MSLYRKTLLLGLMAAVPLAVFARGVDVKSVDWSPHGAGAGCHMNMGPTGARAWMRGYQFEVMTVDAGSPSDGILLPGDRVLGAGGTTFSDDADSRMTLGNAIGRAEAKDGKLKLMILRDGHKRRVKVPLVVTGPYAASWPYGCVKSQRILHDACEYVLEAEFPDGSSVTDGGMGTFLSGLLLLASGEPRFMDGARRAAYATAAMDLQGLDHHNWPLGYGGLLLAEYYLSTGDGSVLPKLKEITDHLAVGQMRCGSWGHKGPAAGYGAMNQAGIVCAIALALAQECGVDVDRDALNRALAFYGHYAELGAVPYGDHMPGVRMPDDNGKSASTAVLCSLLPEWQGAASVFAQSVATSYWMRETGHTGGFFSMVWGPLACAMVGEDPFGTFMGYQSWYYNLCRTWRGALVMLPYYEALTRFDDSSYVWSGGEFTTGGLSLAFAIPHRKLRILGAPRSVFGAMLGGPLLKARECYQARQWEAFEEAVGAARDQHVADGTPAGRWLAQLEDAALMLKATTRRTRREIENNLAEGDAYRASEQFRALKQFLGDGDETIQALEPRFADSTVQWYVRAGGQYYEAWNDLRAFPMQSWIPYGALAKLHVGEVPELRLPLWEALAPVSVDTPREWNESGDGDAVSGKLTFDLETTDYAGLRIELQSPRNSHTEVTLNGVQVAHVVRGRRSGYAKIPLDDTALKLLRVGANELAIESTSSGSGGNALDIGLDGMVRERPLATTPMRVGSALAVPSPPEPLRVALETARATFQTMPLDDTRNPAVPERLRVRDSFDRFKAALDAACDAMSPDELAVALRSPVAYWRHLAGQSLVRRGAVGQRLAAEGLQDPDWHVRSACCDALGAAARDGLDGGMEGIIIVGLSNLLSDENAWVRCRAAGALASVGPAGVTAAAALVKITSDPDPWVRASALVAIGKVTDDPHLLLKAASEALMIPDTSFSVVGRSLPLIEKSAGDNKSVTTSLVFALAHPGEGMGAARLNQVMEILVERDPQGTTAAPAIATVAAGGYAYDRLRGNPRKRAIELLGEMGPRAMVALPTLKAIAARTDEKEQPLRDAAQAAIDQIGGTLKVPSDGSTGQSQ